MSNETLIAILFGLAIGQWAVLLVLARLVRQLTEIVAELVKEGSE